MAKRKKTAEEIADIVAAFYENRTVKDLAAEHGVSTVTLTKYLKGAGVTNSPGQPTLRHRVREPIKALFLEPAYSYLRNLGDPKKTRVMHELVEAHGAGYKWSSREIFRRRLNEWLETPEGRFSQMARLMAIQLAGEKEPDAKAKKNAINQLGQWLKNYTVNIPFEIANAAEELGLDADIMTIKRWLLAKDT